MPVWAAVALGGALGSLARWRFSGFARAVSPEFPWGTVLVNIFGSFAIGAIAAYCAARPAPDWLRIGLMTGVMGGFTTFSAFSLETLDLWRHSPAAALMNVTASVVLSVLACAAGLSLARQMAG